MATHPVVDLAKLDTLAPGFKPTALEIIQEMQAHGWKLRVVWAKRTKAENDVLVAEGKASPTSKHLTGEAVDLIDRVVSYTDDRNHAYYKHLKAACAKHGAKWGGDFGARWDPTHFEAQ